MKTKQELRIESKLKLRELDEKFSQNANQSIFRLFTKNEEYEKAKSIFIFLSTTEEVDTRKIISKAFSDGKKVSLPKIYDKKMIPLQVSENSKFQKNRFGILEPIEGDEAKDVDLCVLPLLAFSRKKARLGRGGGFYDKFLDTFGGRKIALAFSIQEEEFVPTDENDVYMDMIITEKEIIK